MKLKEWFRESAKKDFLDNTSGMSVGLLGMFWMSLISEFYFPNFTASGVIFLFIFWFIFAFVFTAYFNKGKMVFLEEVTSEHDKNIRKAIKASYENAFKIADEAIDEAIKQTREENKEQVVGGKADNLKTKPKRKKRKTKVVKKSDKENSKKVGLVKDKE